MRGVYVHTRVHGPSICRYFLAMIIMALLITMPMMMMLVAIVVVMAILTKSQIVGLSSRTQSVDLFGGAESCF
jgi:hypothetical protein